jgi:hypothetical protein
LKLVKQLDVVTGEFAYIRLLGDRAEVDKRTNTLDHTVIDRSDHRHQQGGACGCTR